MNGSLPSCPRLVDTNLKRGLAGQKFNINGGINQQFIVNDNGVYVGRVKKDGSAALDGRLEDGDKILVINGVLLENRYAGEKVERRKKSHLSTGPPTSKPNRQPSTSTLVILVLFARAASIIVIVALYKRKCKGPGGLYENDPVCL
uniref:PDZ domain-containing protein n=1 Tax=Xiphophorus couchianus TaxID=32473 RepID=A0A3B5MK41_9TELE